MLQEMITLRSEQERKYIWATHFKVIHALALLFKVFDKKREDAVREA